MRTKWQRLSKLRIVVFSTEHPILETLGSLKGTQMNAWSTYLRTQAVLADRVSKTMTTAATIKEFADYAVAFRRDADAEDRTPTHIREGRSIQ
jgi:hypothetical protein